AGARGARNGPGGAPAFPQTGAGGQGGRGRGGNTTLALKAEPAAFGALAGGTDELAPRAAALLARLTWPGKLVAADAPGVAPLTAPQQAMYEAGQTVYNGLCIACHQEDGKGREKVARRLAGSALALAAPGVPV